MLSTCKCTSSRMQQQVEKEQPFIVNHTSCVRMFTKYENDLHTNKWMHKFAQQQVEKRATNSYSYSHILWKCWQNMKLTRWAQVNAQVHKAASGEKRNHSFLTTHPVLQCQPNMNVTYILSTSECTSSHSSKWRKNNHSFSITHLVLEC